jgi:hypothetical protein
MTTVAGTLTVGEYPDEIPGGQQDELWVQQGAAQDEVELYDGDLTLPRLTVSQMEGAFVWRRHIEERVIAIASHVGQTVYLIDLATWQILLQRGVWRSPYDNEYRMEIFATPDESRCVALSDMLIHVFTWRGLPLYSRRIEATDRFVSLANDSITLWDEANGGLEFTMPIPRSQWFRREFGMSEGSSS